MKRLTLLFILSFLGQLVSAQNKPIRKDELLFEKGLLLQQLVDDELEEVINSQDTINSKREFASEMKETILGKALDYYQELIDSFPKSKLAFRALNNIGYIELALDDKVEAKKIFIEILCSKAEDKEKGGIGEGLMAEPYANYKSRASMVLANLYISDSNYNEALKYLDINKKYPFLHFCGNAHASRRIYICSLYAKCYLGLNNDKKALEILLPELLENGLADNSEIVELAFSILTKNYSKGELKTKFEQAFKNYKTEKVKLKDDEYERYFIEFLDTKLFLNSWRLESMNPEQKEKTIDNMCKNSKFFKLLSE